jgi:glycosyltransferase involved in cell wall biosynthesis
MPRRILHVVFSLDAGGMENGVVNISNALAPEEFEIRVCCLARGGEFIRRFPNPERVHILGKKEGFSLSTVSALARHIRAVSPDIIHTHNFGPLIYTALAGPRAPILHGEHAELTPSELAPHRLLIRRRLYSRVRRVHTVSNSLRESLARHGLPAGRIEVVSNGVDTSRFQPGSRDEARRETGLPLDATILGLVGRFGQFKRHTELIVAFDRLAEAQPKLALLFVGGGGPLEAEVRQRAAASPFASRIHFAGFQLDPLPWIHSLDLLVLPSVNEGLSNALLEAMACGVPALAHTACGNNEAIEDGVNGFIRDLGSPDRMTEALAGILAGSGSLPGLGRAARETAEGRFGFAGMVAGYRALYLRL